MTAEGSSPIGSAAYSSRLFKTLADNHQCAIVFHPKYDVTFFGLEKCHPFDSGKWGKIFALLKEAGHLTEDSVVKPTEVNREDLLTIHTKSYLNSLHCSCVLAGIVEVPPIMCIPSCITDRFFLKNMRLQTGGTVAACHLALSNFWAINLGGGFHHASASTGGGFCVYADISISAKILLDGNFIKKLMIVDCDAHQGNGYERDLGSLNSVYILDVFNPSIYPQDFEARKYIDQPVHVTTGISDFAYLHLLETALSTSLGEFSPDLIIYNAGTDCLEGDELGSIGISAAAVIQRDELVFACCRNGGIPIVLLTSGGYQQCNAAVIASSIENLNEKGLIQLK